MKNKIIEVAGVRFKVSADNGCNDTIIYKRICNKLIEVGCGENLYEACCEYDNKRTCIDDISQAFEDYALQNNISYDEDSYGDVFNEWLESISGEEYFELIRDGYYDYYVNWADVKEVVEDEQE